MIEFLKPADNKIKLLLKFIYIHKDNFKKKTST